MVSSGQADAQDPIVDTREEFRGAESEVGHLIPVGALPGGHPVRVEAAQLAGGAAQVLAIEAARVLQAQVGGAAIPAVRADSSVVPGPVAGVDRGLDARGPQFPAGPCGVV